MNEIAYKNRNEKFTTRLKKKMPFTEKPEFRLPARIKFSSIECACVCVVQGKYSCQNPCHGVTNFRRMCQTMTLNAIFCLSSLTEHFMIQN